MFRTTGDWVLKKNQRLLLLLLFIAVLTLPFTLWARGWQIKAFVVELDGLDQLADHLSEDLDEAGGFIEQWKFSKSGNLQFPDPVFKTCIDGNTRYDCDTSVRQNGKIFVEDLRDRNSYDPIPTGGKCSKDLEAPAAYHWEKQAMFIHPDPPNKGTALQIHYATAHELFHAVQRAYEGNNGVFDNLDGWITSGQWFLEGSPDAISYEWLLNSPRHPNAERDGNPNSLYGIRYYSYPLHRPLGRSGAPQAQNKADCTSQSFKDHQRNWILQAQRTSSFWRYLADFRPRWHLVHKVLSHGQSNFNSLAWVDEALKEATNDICTGKTESDLEVGARVEKLLASASLSCDQIKLYGGLFLFYPNFIAQHTQDMLARDRKAGNEKALNATFRGGCELAQAIRPMDPEIGPVASRCIRVYLGSKTPLSVSASLASNPKGLGDLSLSINGCLMVPTIHKDGGPGGTNLKVWDLAKFAICNPRLHATPINADTGAYHLVFANVHPNATATKTIKPKITIGTVSGNLSATP